MEVKRPKRLKEETEDDLILLQEQFIKDKSQPSVKVVREQKSEDEGIKKNVLKVQEKMEIDDSIDSKSILSDIIERTPQVNQIYYQRGYQPPKIEKLDKKDIQKATKTKSLFAQQLEKQGKLKKYHELKEEKPKVDQLGGENLNFYNKNQLITGEGITGSSEAKKIHEENLQKLAGMNRDEILKEQQRLLNTLDPKIISFIRKRKITEPDTKKPEHITHHEVELPKLAQSEIPVPNKWLSMGKMEYEKLAWTGDLPKPNLSSDNTVTARFGFDGRIIEPDEDIPVTKALHHHGNEPERAGYSLEELYHLARSNFNQQRTLAIQTLGNIIRKCQEGEFEGRLKDPLLDTLINGGIIFLLRWCLDDQTESIIIPTLEAISNLVQPTNQEIHLDFLYLDSYKFYIQPSCYPFTTMSQDTLKELNDLDYLKVDTIKGLLKMNLLQRLKYLLDIYKIKAVDTIFSILFRLARHSSELCYVLTEKYDLLDVVFSNFLPITWTMDDQEQYGRPHSNALKLIRLICQGGQSISLNIYKRYDLKSVIIRYLLIKSNDKLVLEAINLLTVLSVYGISYDFLIDSYELILNEIRIHVNNKNTALIKAYLNLFTILVNKTEDDTFKNVIASLSGSVFQTVLFLVKQQNTDMSLQSICHQNLADYIANFAKLVPTGELLNRNEIVHQIYDLIFKHLFSDSLRIDHVLSKLSTYSIRFQQEPVKLVKSNNLTYLPSLLLPVNVDFFNLNKEIPYPYFYLISLVKLFSTLLRFKVDQDFELKLSNKFLSNSYLKSYLRHAFLRENIKDDDCYLTRYEDLLAFYCVKLAIQQCNYEKNDISSEDISFYHSIAFSLLTKFKNGDEYYINYLFFNVIFNYRVWSSLTKSSTTQMLRKFTRLSMNEVLSNQKSIKTASGDLLLSFQGESELRDFERGLLDELTSLKMNYLNSLFTKENNTSYDLTRSNCLIELQGDIGTCFLSRYKEIALFNNDWIFMPILITLQKNENLIKANQDIDYGPQIQIVSNTLKFILLCESYRYDYTSQISPTIRFVRFMSIFLTDSQVFLDKKVSLYLYILLLNFIETEQINKLKFDTTRIPGIMSFHDFYKHLCINYDSVSFGDRLYALYLLAPMQQYCACKYRKLFWTEFNHLFKYFKFELPSELAYPIENFLRPYETNVEILEIYFKYLLDNTNADVNNTSIGYLIALNHVNSYLFDQSIDKIHSKKLMINELNKDVNEMLRCNLLKFKYVDKDGKIEFFDNLPDIRVKWLQQISSLN